MAATIDATLEETLEGQISAATLKRIPFAFAKRHGVLLQESGDGPPKIIYRPGARAVMCRRKIGWT